MLQLSDDLRKEYTSLFGSMEIDAERRAEINLIFKRITSTRAQTEYKALEDRLKIPWFVVGIIHNLEASGRFTCHLHNGDPLTARTRHVPANRPKALPAAGFGNAYSWQESAADALKLHGLDQVGLAGWDLPTIAFHLECYNGLGYRRHHPWVKSPYLWSFSNIYSKGKYVADGSFSASAVSDQCGGLAMLRHMMDIDPTIKQSVTVPAVSADDDEIPDAAADTPYPSQDEGGRDWPESPPVFGGDFLTRGLSGAIIRSLQDRLASVGAAAIGNGIFDDITELAVKLFQARSVDERGDPLEVDGIVGPATWRALFGPDSTKPVSPSKPPQVGTQPQTAGLAGAVIQVAFEQVGTMEVPPGSNGGPEVEMYLSCAGSGRGNAWCMAFVYWVHKEAATKLGARLLVPRTALVLDAWTRSQHLPEVPVVTRSRARGNPSLVTPGMVFFLDLGGGHGHCGIVIGNQGGVLTTIEGNTNDNGSREGVGVFVRKKRTVSSSSLLGFADYTNANQ